MVTEYQHRYIIIVQWNRLVPANARAAAWDPDTGGAETFGALRLSADGNEPSTHSACFTAATDTMKAGILEAQSQVPWQELYDITNGWTWESALMEQGYKLSKRWPNVRRL